MCHHFIDEKDKKPIHTDYFALSEDFESIHKVPQVKVDDRV